MIVVNSKAGQRSNRLISIAHAMGTAIERRETLVLTAFSSYVKDYPRLLECAGCKVVVKESHFWEIIRLGIAAIKRVWTGFEVNIPGYITIVSDFSYRNDECRKKYAQLIREAFDIGRRKLLREDNMVWVGVHIRWGDYKKWRGGMYFYDVEVYARIIESMQKEVRASGKNVRIILFSNERITSVKDKFGVECDYYPGNTDVYDQWLMSQCDYLVGPPSTFTMWASFMGKVPLLHIEEYNQKFSLKDFKCHWI